jgi:AraC-like DNA-binding protein
LADKAVYQNAAALERAFQRKVGRSPAAWLNQAELPLELRGIAEYRSSGSD